MTIQVYGANGQTPPTSITDPAWVKLTHSMLVSKRHERIRLHDTTHGFRFVTVWISRAPAASVGTPEAPGRVSVNELELFPAA
jgi:CRISPR-associated DxTHG motif protein